MEEAVNSSTVLQPGGSYVKTTNSLLKGGMVFMIPIIPKSVLSVSLLSLGSIVKKLKNDFPLMLNVIKYDINTLKRPCKQRLLLLLLLAVWTN